MHVGGGESCTTINGFALRFISQRSLAAGVGERFERRVGSGIMKRVATQRAFGKRSFLPAKCGKAWLHADVAGEKRGHGVRCPLHIGERVKQGHHAAAFGEQWLIGGDVDGDLGKEFMAVRQRGRMQFGIAPGEPECVTSRQAITGQW